MVTPLQYMSWQTDGRKTACQESLCTATLATCNNISGQQCGNAASHLCFMFANPHSELALLMFRRLGVHQNFGVTHAKIPDSRNTQKNSKAEANIFSSACTVFTDVSNAQNDTNYTVSWGV